MKKITVIIIVIIILGIGGIFLLGGKFGKKETAPTPTPTIAPQKKEEKAKVSLSSKDSKSVTLKIDDFSADVISIEYELSYDTNKGPRGVLGKIQTKGESSISKEILLGTCSRNVCVYDQGVTKVSLNLKFDYASRESTGFSKEYDL